MDTHTNKQTDNCQIYIRIMNYSGNIGSWEYWKKYNCDVSVSDIRSHLHRPSDGLCVPLVQVVQVHKQQTVHLTG